MTESPSDTSNHQRFDEMFIHLTPRGAVIPYSVCVDDEGSYWVASKGGLFKFSSDGSNLLYQMKNPFPKRISPYCQVLCFERKIIYAFAEDQAGMTEFRIFNLSGEMQHEQFIDGRLQSLVITEDGDLYLTKQPQGEDSVIYKTSLDCPLGWEAVLCEDEFVFQSLCVLNASTLIAATCSVPVNMYSKQNLRLIDIGKRKITKTFSEKGKNNGQIYFPRSIQRYKDEILVLDKTGRIQRFSESGTFLGIASHIDAYLGNGFIVEGDRAVMACSGIVLDHKKKTICDDWLEKIELNGSRWSTAATPS